ncbi:septum site-determining protein MinD [Lactobacillus sp. DCY120]|uniref:Septum site-determining protein MinD n=1 Tax=Bombilactobacillus apium TaxID=2675299 RepID=A0A850R555_9LACO|nr:septum site-determining protein MinD [Bombilactobacillus apium]NVY95665.1 septum site-determining protein MinD [Bombilactobacillus apium]
MGTSIVITSGKGGVGKTTTTANLGIALAQNDKRVCVVDLDLGLRNLDAMLGLSNRVIYDVVDVLEGRADLFQALVKYPEMDGNLFFLAAAQNATQSKLQVTGLKQIINDLKENFDLVIVDCPAGIETGFMAAVAVADSAIIVTTPESVAVGDADRVVGILENSNLQYGLHLVINRVRVSMMQKGTSIKIKDIVNRLSAPLIGVIVDEDEVIAAANQGQSIVTLDNNSPAAVGYSNLARRILGEKIPLNEIELDTSENSEKSGFWHRLFHH